MNREQTSYLKTMPVAFLVALLSLALTTNAFAADLKAVRDKDTVTIKDGDCVSLVYRSAPGPFKVYIKELYTPAGLQVLRDSPHDHVHHHDLMYAIGAEETDFWGEAPQHKPGKQVPRGQDEVTVEEVDGKRCAVIRQTIDWIGVNGNCLLVETRTITLDPASIPGASLLTWDSQFEVAEVRDSTKLWGRKYFGLGVRFVTSMDKVGEFLHAAEDASQTASGSDKALRADWCAYTAPVDTKPVTFAMFDHPENPRHPAAWFTMTSTFAYMSATLNLAEEPMTVVGDKPIRVRYGVALWDGKVEAERIGRAYQAWTGAR